MWYAGLLMSHGLPKISMFRSWGRLQAHTHIPSHHRHQYIRTLYRASPVTYNTVIPHIDYWPVGIVETCLRNASSSFRVCAVAYAREVWDRQSFGGGDRRRSRLQSARQLSILRKQNFILSRTVDISTRPIFIINISRPNNCHEHYCDMSCI
jgi:hypothetical protein